ncbi:MAG: hypothetical protein GY788_12475 [bacterium]|nr:hypothetical protein [bacterium]
MADPLHELLNPEMDQSRGKPMWPWLVGSILLVGALVLAIVQLGGSNGISPDSAAPAVTSTTSWTSSSMAVDNSGTVSVEPSVVLEQPRVIQAQLGPDPEYVPSGLGEEQILLPVDGVGLEDMTWFETQEANLDVTERVAIGTVGGQTRLYAVAGTIADPYLPSYGAPGYCHLLSTGTDRVSSCFAYDPPGNPTALFVGSIGIDFVAWGHLGEDVSVAVLTVNNVALAWQRPRDSTVVFSYAPQIGDDIDLTLLTALGVEMGRSDRSRPIDLTGGYVEAIVGYGDFNSVAFDDIDDHQVNTLIVECMNDAGYAAELLPAQEGVAPETIGLFDIAARDWPAANLTHAKCRAGLNLPNKPPRSAEEIRSEYDSLVEVQLCLANLGFSIDPAPQFDQWVESSPETRWDPILSVGMSNPAGAQEALKTCLDSQ